MGINNSLLKLFKKGTILLTAKCLLIACLFIQNTNAANIEEIIKDSEEKAKELPSAATRTQEVVNPYAAATDNMKTGVPRTNIPNSKASKKTDATLNSAESNISDTKKEDLSAALPGSGSSDVNKAKTELEDPYAEEMDEDVASNNTIF